MTRASERVRFGIQEWVAVASLFVTVLVAALSLGSQLASINSNIDTRLTTVEVKVDVLQAEVGRLRDK